MMAEQTKSYVYVVERAEDGAYWGYLPDFPGCTTTGETAEEVEEKLPEAVELYLSYYRERGMAEPVAAARVGSVTAA